MVKGSNNLLIKLPIPNIIIFCSVSFALSAICFIILCFREIRNAFHLYQLQFKKLYPQPDCSFSRNNSFTRFVVDFADVVMCVFFVICFCACLLVVCYNMIIIVCGKGILSNLVRNNVSNKTTSIIEQHRGIYKTNEARDVKHIFLVSTNLKQHSKNTLNYSPEKYFLISTEKRI